MQGSLAKKLRILRAERAMNLTEAAEATGVQRQTLADLERGVRRPHDPTLVKIARGYGVPFEELLEAQEPETAGLQKAGASYTGPPEIDLEQLHNAGIPAGTREWIIVNEGLVNLWRGEEGGVYDSLVLAYVLTHLEEFFSQREAEALNAALHEMLVPELTPEQTPDRPDPYQRIRPFLSWASV